MSPLNIRFIRVYVAFASALLLVTSLEQAWAQGSTATVVGTVNDTSGAAIPGASVDVKNTGTGAVRKTVTDEQGRFRVVDLLIGEYEVQASHPGFQTILRKGILLTVGSDPVVDFSTRRAGAGDRHGAGRSFSDRNAIGVAWRSGGKHANARVAAERAQLHAIDGAKPGCNANY